jgi:hypothetical protein
LRNELWGSCHVPGSVAAGYFGAQSGHSSADPAGDFWMIMLEVAFGRGLARVFAGSVADGTDFDCTVIFDFSSPALVTSSTARV